MPVLPIVIPGPELIHKNINHVYCDYPNTRELRIFYQATDITDEWTKSLPIGDSGAYKIDQTNRKILFQASSDTIINKLLDDYSIDCNLSDPDVKQCSFNFKVQEIGLHGSYGPFTEFTINIHSECLRLAEAGGNMPTSHAYWSWSDQNRAIVASGYRLRDPAIEFHLPVIKPKLFSDEYFYDRCGPIHYNITAVPFPSYFDWSYD